MIRINLIRTGPAPGVKPPGPPTTLGRHIVVFLVSLGLMLLAVVLLWRVWSKNIDELQEKLKHERDEQARLASFKAENLKFEQQKRQLEQRINTIQMLQASRVGPAELMTALANTVNRTNDLYLLSVGPPPRVAIRGESDSVESIARFIAALKKSGSFDDVQLQQYYQDDRDNRLSFKFNLDCLYKVPTVPVAATPATPPRRAGK